MDGGTSHSVLTVHSSSTSAPVNTRLIILPGLATRSLSICSCSTLCTRTHSPHPPPWPRPSFPDCLMMQFQCTRTQLAVSSSLASHGESVRLYWYTSTL